jgi:hypothetical protein
MIIEIELIEWKNKANKVNNENKGATPIIIVICKLTGICS